jgi:hypothetical protein
MFVIMMMMIIMMMIIMMMIIIIIITIIIVIIIIKVTHPVGEAHALHKNLIPFAILWGDGEVPLVVQQPPSHLLL